MNENKYRGIVLDKVRLYELECYKYLKFVGEDIWVSCDPKCETNPTDAVWEVIEKPEVISKVILNRSIGRLVDD